MGHFEGFQIPIHCLKWAFCDFCVMCSTMKFHSPTFSVRQKSNVTVQHDYSWKLDPFLFKNPHLRGTKTQKPMSWGPTGSSTSGYILITLMYWPVLYPQPCPHLLVIFCWGEKWLEDDPFLSFLFLAYRAYL